MKYFIILILFITILFAEDTITNQEQSYQLGNGMQVGELPLYVGGYFSLDYRYKDGENRYRIDDIAFLAYGGYEKISYMAELEYKEFYTLSEKDDAYTTQKDTRLHTERLYGDYNFNENYMLRLGKFNSQIGFWNLLPINVLRDTSSNPYTTDIIFPRFTTGLYAAYNSYNNAEIQIDLTIQHNEDLDPSYNNYTMDEHHSLGTTYTQENISLKASIGMFDKYTSTNTTQVLYYALVSLKYETEKFQFMSELGSQKSTQEYTTPYAFFAQGVYHLNQEHAGIIRLESYEDKVQNTQDNIAIFGYTYRPLYPIAFKTEYQFHKLQNENQFLFSWSVLF